MRQRPSRQPSAPHAPAPSRTDDQQPVHEADRSTTRRQVLAGAGGLAAVGLTGSYSAHAAAPETAERDITARARALARDMSLEDKVGQLFVVEVYGQSADSAHPKNEALYGVSTPAEVITRFRPGGVIYFDARRGPDNLKDPRQIVRLSNGLQRAALHSGARVPLHISIDQEGGSVVYRMGSPATELPGNMALAASRSGANARRSAEIIGSELAALGINQNYAPCADVNVNPQNPIIGVRSFGSDPALCSEFVTQSVRGYHRSGTASAAKHFPGHGDTDTDSHTGLPEITHTREELDRIDLPPFRAAIDARVDTIMTAHIVVPSLDPSRAPATMSHRIVTGLLREELGYKGLVVTDALDMQGATEDFPPDVAPVRAFRAGVDQLVLAPQLRTAREAVLSAVRSGEITGRRLDESVVRILEHKLRNGLFPDPYVHETRAERTVGSRRHAAAAARITDRGITLIRNERDTLPLSGRNRRTILVTGWDEAQVKLLARTIGERTGQRTTALATGAAPDAAKRDAAASAAREHDVTVVLTNAAAATGDKGAAQARLVDALGATPTTLVAVALRNPYDIQRYPDAPDAYLATYAYGAPTLASLDRVLYGDTKPTGRLPVPVTAHDDPKTTLYPYGHGLTY
ncbi:glycoside hydrolase family 3 protein [Streptomyces sp. HNM0574]|uniref:glycoside hydrolase family 3 protein n=1 Tax=Streptomyces sp. HNM0574 TaxID=2714954 RepID=UPI00146CEA52|nr:glycoside hydrolase family 3 protein [Streptomyces sp. HNM0574]NLU70062.1 glycoside hydrolase family 3 protein [Streptomyces sp. HNM0574]